MPVMSWTKLLKNCLLGFLFIKALYVTYSGALQEIACENEEMRLSCEEGYLLAIEKVNYGRTDDSACSGLGPIKTTACIRDVTLEVTYTCEGLRSCDLTASNTEFGDPCSGTVKYLDVSYSCLGDGSIVEATGCPSGFVFNPDTSSCYYFSTDSLSHSDAETECRKQHRGHLVSIQSKEELLFVISNSDGASDYWSGLSRESSGSSIYTWTDGQPFSFPFWSNNEPDNSPDPANCIRLKYDSDSFTLADYSCSFEYKYICKCPSLSDSHLVSGYMIRYKYTGTGSLGVITSLLVRSRIICASHCLTMEACVTFTIDDPTMNGPLTCTLLNETPSHGQEDKKIAYTLLYVTA